MTFRISLSIFGLFFMFPAFVQAQTGLSYPDKRWINRYQTNSIQFISPGSDFATATPGRHPAWVQNLINRYLSYQPVDNGPKPTGECDPYKLQEAIRFASDVRSRTRILEAYQSKCSSAFVQGSPNSLKQALQIFSMKYNIDENPFLHRVVFHLPDGQKLKGVLALKDNRVRPLIIVRAGISGNVEEAYAERFFLYQFFERGLFNVLLVENMTGSDYIHFNKSLAFGGLAESYQNIYLAQLLRSRSQPLSQVVHSVHLVGLSLGGQGVLTSAWLARYQSNPKLFSSYLALCPLVNTKDTFEYLFQKSLMRFPLELWAHSRFGEFKLLKPELFQSFWGLPQRLLGAVAQNYKRPNAQRLYVREPWFVQNQNNFYSLHQLAKWDHTLRDPTWVWVTNEDKIVPVSLNTDQLQLTTPVRIDQGHHCSFPVVWDNRVLSNILTGHILGSTEFPIGSKEVKLMVEPTLKWDLGEIRFQDDRQVIEVELVSDKQKRSFMVNRSDLDFGFTGQRLTEHEKFMIRRWLSSNLRWAPDERGLSLLVSWPMVR